MNPIVIRLLVLAGVFAGGCAVGWKGHAGVTAERELAAADQEKKDQETFVKRESNIAAIVERKIADLRANEKTLEIQREIVKPVFRNVCVSDDFVRMWNNRTSKATNAGTSKPAD